ncbi:MAG: hypothetical protein K2P86_00700 [Xanthobacteraceae bacterium]|nr:hypothetical protein [Xanthobacteraceae bacterium]
MDTGLYLLLFGLPVWFAALFFAPKSGHHKAANHIVLFWIGGGMSIIGWIMTVIFLGRRWEIHPAIAIVVLLGGFGMAGLALQYVENARKKRTD